MARTIEVPQGVDYESLRERLSRAVLHSCPRVMAAYRDDLVQNCMVRVLDIIRKTGPERQFSSSYLYKVAYSALVDEIRRMRRRPESPLDEGQRVPTTAPEGNPEVLAANRDVEAGILDCMSHLLQERRLAVALYLQGHTVVEAARILGWSPKRVDNLLYRGLANLRECITAKGLHS
jgi:RNA polymerase sigma-70 factor, ECF subfamily